MDIVLMCKLSTYNRKQRSEGFYCEFEGKQLIGKAVHST